MAARRIRAGETAFGGPNDNFWSLTKHLESGRTVPPMIIVTADDRKCVVLEGHARLTAYALVPEALTPEVTVLVGSSPAIARWGLY